MEYTRGAPAPIPRYESAVGVARRKLFVIGGFTEPRLAGTRCVYAYDPAADVWTRGADAPLKISHVIAAVVADRYIWVAGGYEGDHPGVGVQSTWRYDIEKDNWDEGPPLPAIRATLGFVLIDDRLHCVGGLGEDRHTNFDDHWVTSADDPGRWDRLAPMPRARTHASAAALDGKIYIMGGHYSHDFPGQPGVEVASPDLDDVLRYDPAEDRWEEVAPLPQRRSHCEPGTVVHDGNIILVGGRNNSPDAIPRHTRRTPVVQMRRAFRKVRRLIAGSPEAAGLPDITAYDPAADRWFELATLPLDLLAPAAGVIDDTLIVTNGGVRGWRVPSHGTFRFDLQSARVAP